MKTLIASTLRKFAFYFFEHARIISDFARERRKQKYDELSELKREFQRKRIKIEMVGTQESSTLLRQALRSTNLNHCVRAIFFFSHAPEETRKVHANVHAWAQNSWRVASPYISSD